MLCRDIMKDQVERLILQDTVQVAARKMRDANIGFLPVVDGQVKPVGTLTDRDIVVRLVAVNRPVTTPVSEVMTREVISCRPEDDVSKAEDLMAKHQISRILCVDKAGRLAGVISLSDIARTPGDRGARVLREVSEREVRE